MAHDVHPASVNLFNLLDAILPGTGLIGRSRGLAKRERRNHTNRTLDQFQAG